VCKYVGRYWRSLHVQLYLQYAVQPYLSALLEVPASENAVQPCFSSQLYLRCSKLLQLVAVRCSKLLQLVAAGCCSCCSCCKRERVTWELFRWRSLRQARTALLVSFTWGLTCQLYFRCLQARTRYSLTSQLYLRCSKLLQLVVVTVAAVAALQQLEQLLQLVAVAAATPVANNLTTTSCNSCCSCC
jgi:hypothetical protein